MKHVQALQDLLAAPVQCSSAETASITSCSLAGNAPCHQHGFLRLSTPRYATFLTATNESEMRHCCNQMSWGESTQSMLARACLAVRGRPAQQGGSISRDGVPLGPGAKAGHLQDGPAPVHQRNWEAAAHYLAPAEVPFHLHCIRAC